MKRFFFSFSLIFCVSAVYCQQEYFVFIQETGHHPFYVRIGDKSHSSTSEGHLILSKLRDTVYRMYVGFPKNSRAEQQFIISVNKKDRGYDLKNNNGQWLLLDIQTGEPIKPIEAFSRESLGVLQKKTDTYSELMAGVVNDSAVLYGYAVPGRKDSLPADDITVNPVKDSTKSAAIDTTAVKHSGVVQKAVAGQKNGKRNANGNIKGTINAQQAVSATQKTAGEEAGNAGAGQTTTNAVRQVTNATQEEPKAAQKAELELPPTAPERVSSSIIRFSTENTVQGKMMIFIDRGAVSSDTIRLIIPVL